MIALPPRFPRSPVGTVFLFLNDTPTTEIYTLSLHDALPIAVGGRARHCAALAAGPLRHAVRQALDHRDHRKLQNTRPHALARSAEHTSELQPRQYLVWRLMLERKPTVSTLVTPTLRMPFSPL